MTRNQTIKLLRFSIFLSAVLIVLGYALFRSLDYIKGPEIIIESPLNGTTVSTPSVIVKGYALRVSDLWLNDRPITLSEEGYFEESMLLNIGYNTISVKTRDKFGRNEDVLFEIIRKDF